MNTIKNFIRSVSALALLSIFILPPALKAQDGVTRTNITFDNGRFTLHGELILADSAQNAPVIIFLVGSGANSSHRTLYKNFVEQNIEQQFLNEGIGLLYFDKRGVGDSEGRWQRTNLYERAEDAKAAIDFLKTQGRIDSSKIGVIGHSQGGIVAQIMGDLYSEDLKFVASLAAPTFDTELHLTNTYYSRFRCEGMSDEEAFDKAGKKAVSDINWVSWFPIRKPWRQLREIREFDPAPHLQNIEIPALFAFAENDYYVYPGWAIGALNELFTEGIPGNYNLQIIPAADHDFRLADMCTAEEEAAGEPYSEYFQQVLKDWVLTHF